MRIWTVAAATWREAVRQPVSIIILVMMAFVTFAAQFLNFYHFDAETGYNAIRQMSVASTLVCGIVIAVFTASRVLADEIESRAILTLLAKPIQRCEIILGKFTGIMMAILAAFLVMAAVSMLTAWWTEAEVQGPTRIDKWRANPCLAVTELPALATGQGALQVAESYGELVSRREGQGLDYLQSVGDFLMLLTGQSSQLVARAPLAAELKETGKARGGYVDTRYVRAASPGLASFVGNARTFLAERMGVLPEAFVLAFAHVMVIAAVAVAVSTRLPLVFNALFCAAIFVLGNLSRELGRALTEADMGGGVSGALGRAASWPVIALCRLLPNFENLNLTDPLATGITRVGPSVWIYGSLYGFLYAAAVLGVAVLLFRRREVA
ncbi:MAG: ABC transporter permease [Planctomycetota bacterium]